MDDLQARARAAKKAVYEDVEAPEEAEPETYVETNPEGDAITIDDGAAYELGKGFSGKRRRSTEELEG